MANDIVLPFETVSNESELNQDLAAMAGLRQAAGDYAINIGSNFTLGTDLLAVNSDHRNPTSGEVPHNADAARQWAHDRWREQVSRSACVFR